MVHYSNFHIFHDEHKQHHQEFDLWAGIFGGRIVGSSLLEGNLSGELYQKQVEDNWSKFKENYWIWPELSKGSAYADIPTRWCSYALWSGGSLDW